MRPAYYAIGIAAILLSALPAAAQRITAPAGFVPQQAVAYGAAGATATAVDADHGLPVADRANAAFTGIAAITPGVQAPAGRSLLANCSAAGDAGLTFVDGSTLAMPLQAGLTILPFAVSSVSAAATTAICTYANLK